MHVADAAVDGVHRGAGAQGGREASGPASSIVPTMLPGYTDGKYLNPAGIPTYGLSGLFEDAEGNYIHGLNERMRVKSLMEGRRFLHEVVKLYADSED